MPDMAHQLYVLQSLLFNLLDEKRNTPADANDQVSGWSQTPFVLA